jgi:prevent-host-death family protein
MTRTFNIAEAKAKLSELVEAASRGEEIVLARHGRPMARIAPYKRAVGRPRRIGVLRDRLSDAEIAELTKAIEKPLSREEAKVVAGHGTDEFGIRKIKTRRNRA